MTRWKEVQPRCSRRTVLGTVAAGAFAAATGTATAAEENGDDQSDGEESGDPEWGSALPEEEALLAGYSFEDGEYVFETGRDSLDVGDEIRFMTTTDDDGGSRWFHWDASPYEVATVAVRYGDQVERVDVDGASSGKVDLRERIEGDVPAIDAVEFGITVRWQVDFGTGEVPVPPVYWPEFLVAALGETPGGATRNPSTVRPTDDVAVELVEDEFEIDGTEASIAFEVTGDEPEELHLASFELPGEYAQDEVDEQVLYDSTVREFDPGEHTVSVSLPAPDSLSAADFEDEDVDETEDVGGSDSDGDGETDEDGASDDEDSGESEAAGDSEETDDEIESAEGDAAAGRDGDESGGSGATDDGDAGDSEGGDETGADGTDGSDDGSGNATADEPNGTGNSDGASADGLPGPGVVGALTSLGGLGYVLARRTGDGE